MTALPHGTPVYTNQEIRRIESLAASQPDAPGLMERAGLAAAKLARELAGDSGKRIIVVAGPGNNGGDALVVARHLRQWWFDVVVVFEGAPEKLSPDAASALAAWQAAGGSFAPDLPSAHDVALVVDGLFGIGLTRGLTGRYAEIVTWINAARAPVLALDVPSGLDSDSGRTFECAVRASHTITFIGLKPGLFTLDGPDHAGEIHIAALELHAPDLLPATGSLIGHEVLQHVLTPRKSNSHKGSFGSVGIIGGAEGMIGAALLAGRAALMLGAGRVYVGLLDERAPTVDVVQPELMLRRAEAVLELDHLSSLGVGPGLGQSPQARALLQRALALDLPLVLDADALNLIALDEGLRAEVAKRTAPTLLTPHPAEAARLLGVGITEIQGNRVTAAVEIAEKFRGEVVLKGAGSICASRNGRWAINTSGNPGMASGGMGDVLTGILTALLAQAATAESALQAGVYLHGAAADALVADAVGPVGLTAGEIIEAARALLNTKK